MKLTISKNSQYFLQESFLFLGFSFLLLLFGTTPALISYDLLVVLAIFISLAFIVWWISGSKKATPLALPLIGWVAACILTTIFSIDFRRSLNQVGLVLLAIGIFALIADLVARGWSRELFSKTLLLAGALYMALGWMQVIFWYLSWLQVEPGQWFPATIFRPDNANILAMVYNILLLQALAAWGRTHSTAGRAALVIYSASCLGLLLISSSRGGFLGTAAGIGMLVLLSFPRLGSLWQDLRQKVHFSPAVLVAAGVGVLALILLFGWIAGRSFLHPTHGPLLNSRDEFWGPAWQAFLKSPVLGTGPFTYGNSYLAVNSVPPRLLFIHSHGTPVNLLSEMGIAGALTMGWLVVVVVLAFKKQISRIQGEERTIVIGAAAAVAAMAVHSLFDCFHSEPIGLWVLAITLGTALGAPDWGKPALKRPYWLIFPLALVWLEVYTLYPIDRGAAEANNGQWQNAVTSFNEAIRRDPGSVVAHQQLALADSVLADQGNTEALKSAVGELEKTIELEPAWGINYLNLGALYAAQGEHAQTVQTLEESTRRAYNCPMCWLNLGLAYESMGNTAKASKAYTRALDLFQGEREAYFWRQTETREKIYQEWLNAHPQAARATDEELQQKLKADPQQISSYNALAERYLQENHLDEAEHMLNQASLMYSFWPEDVLETTWLKAELAADRGNLQEAVLQGQYVMDHYLLQGLYGPGSFGQIRYANIMFRRPAMAMEMIPQVTLVPLTGRWGTRMARLAEWYDQVGDTAKAEKVRSELIHFIPDYQLP
jgi:tetratricopeptide (TPR) repeat protein/O-antigen ligase